MKSHLTSVLLSTKTKFLFLFCFAINSYSQTVITKKDQFTGENVIYQQTLTFSDGSRMTKENVDGIIFISENHLFYKRKFDGKINVKWFGVMGNGDRNDNGTDDSKAIDFALNILNKIYKTYDLTGGNLFGGYSLFFPAGKYLVNKTFILPNNITLSGESLNSTVIHAIKPRFIFTNIGGIKPNGVDYIMNSNITIKNLTLTQGGIEFQQAVSSRIEDVRIMNLFGSGTDTGISIKLSVDLRVKNVKIFGSTGIGILFQEDIGGKVSTSTSFDNVWLTHCKVGMLVDGSNGSLGIITSNISNSIIEYNQIGIKMIGKIRNFALRDSHFEQNSVNALQIDGDVNLVLDNVWGDDVGDINLAGQNNKTTNKVYLNNVTIPSKQESKFKGEIIKQ